MPNKKRQLSHRELLLTAVAVQNDLADPERISEAIEQAMVDTDHSFADALKQVTNLDDDTFETLDRLVDLKASRNEGDEEAAFLQTLDSNPNVKSSLIAAGSLDATSVPETCVDYSASAKTDDLPVSTRYDLSNVHARGGLGRVWRANDRLLSREVAIKEILPSSLSRPAVNQRFLREAKITGQLEHPGIVPVYDIGRLPEEGQPFYAMRFVDGETLSSRIKEFHQIPAGSEESSLQLRQLLSTMVSICNAVGFAHSRKVLHRDLKPDNVVLGSFGEVSVLDWGLARIIGSDDFDIEDTTQAVEHDQVELTAAGSIMGTPAYMAPEQATGDTDQLTEATDIYALGTILYQILTGEPPFIERNFEKLVKKIVGEPVASPREKKSFVPRPLASICLKALEKQPTDRYLSATDLAGDINRFLADEKVSVHDESMVEQTRRWIRKNRTLVTSVTAAMMVAIIGLSIAAILLNAARQRESIAKQKIASQKSDIEVARNDLENTNAQLETVNSNLKTANLKVEKSLKDARDAIDNWYTLVATNTELANSPKSSAFRKQLLQKASEYYEQFLNELPEDESLQVSAAQSHIRLAVIKLELEPGLAAVPHFEKAEQIYSSLLEIRPADRDLKMALAGVFNDESAAFYQVNQMETALGLLDKTEAIYAELAEISPADSVLKSKLATLIANRGEIFLKLNKLPECIQSFTNAIAAHEKLLESEFEIRQCMEALGSSHFRRGAAKIKLRQYAEGRTDLEKSIEIRNELCELNPADPKYRSDLANVLSDFGTLTMATGDIPTAKKTFRDTIDLAAELAADFPSVPNYQRNLVLAHANLAKALNTAKELDGALTSYKNAKKVSVELARQFSEVPQYVSLDSDLSINYGILLANLGRNGEAIEQFEEAAAIQKKLTEDHPDLIRYAISLVNTRNNVAAMHIRNNDLEKSAIVTETLIEECQDFVDRWPDSVDLQLTLAAIHSHRAASRSQMDDPRGAEQDFQAALKIRKSFSAKFPDNNEVLGDLAESYNNYGVFLTFIGKAEDACSYLENAVDTRKQLAERQPGVEANTDVAVSMFALGQAHMHDDAEKSEGLLTEAIDLLVAAIGRSPQYTRAQQYLMLTGQSRAWVRWDQGEQKEAITDMEQLLAIKTARIKNESRASLAYFYLKMGKLEKGAELLDETRLVSVVTSRSQLDYAAAHALRRKEILADESVDDEQRTELAERHLQRSIAGIKVALASLDVTSRETLESISNNDDFASVTDSDEFKQLRAEQEN